METYRLVFSIYVVFCLALARESNGYASLTAEEDFWQTVWPNTPIPSVLNDLLKPTHTGGVGTDNLPMEIGETQYPKAFFFEEDLYPGKTMNVQFSKQPFAQPWGAYYWLRDIRRVNLNKEGYTLDELCGRREPEHVEHKFCAKSLGTLMGFAMSKLGKNIQAFSSSFVKNQEQYTIEGVQNLGDQGVMCHRLNFQKAVFYCHEVRATTSFNVQLVAADGTKTQALAVCHSDTSAMNHQRFYEDNKFAVGTKPLCHFIGSKAIIWVSNPPLDTAYNINSVI